MKDEYTFVTLDNDLLTMGDAVFVDIDDTADNEPYFVQIDDSYDASADQVMEDFADFIMMDDMDIINDLDIDAYSSDINEADIAIFV